MITLLSIFASASQAQTLGVSQGMNVTGAPKFLYCEFQGVTPRYGFETGALQGKLYTYNGAALNLSAYENTRRVENQPRPSSEAHDQVNQQHSAKVGMFFIPKEGKHELYEVSFSLGESLFVADTTVVSFFINVTIDDKDIPQVKKQVQKNVNLKDIDNGFEIDFSDPVFHESENKSKKDIWVNAQGKPTYSLKLQCRKY
jgi:hypothetical protein